jgi:hypothetical protein
VASPSCCAARTSPDDDHDPPGMIRLTVNEIRRLTNVLLIRPIHDLARHLCWSQWRRWHQAQRNEPATPDASVSNSSHDHRSRLPH